MTQETEVKIALQSIAWGARDAQVRIEELGFRVYKPKVFERNLVFDREDAPLRPSRQLLRLRKAGGSATLTYKGGPLTKGKHKSREERETTVDSFGEMRVILERLGFTVRFIYEKYRTEFRETEEGGIITLDETPIGDYLEIEGQPDWIDQTAKRLGIPEVHYLTTSYTTAYDEWCARHGVTPGNMTF